MARSSTYRRTEESTSPTRGLPRWALLAAFILAVLAAIQLIAGSWSVAVYQTLIFAIFPLSLLIAATMLGLAFTATLQHHGGHELFAASPWPSAWRLVISTALGLGALALATLALGSAGLVASPWIVAALLFIAAAIGFLPTRTFLRACHGSSLRAPATRSDWLVLLTAAPVAMLIVAATFPAGTLWNTEGHGYDVLEYHLELPRQYALSGSTAPLAHNVYSYFPANTEMLYLLVTHLARLGMQTPSALYGIYPSQFLHAAMTLLAAAAIGLMPIRLSKTARWLAVAVFLGVPWTIICGSLAYNDNAVLLFGILALGLALGPSNRSATLLIGVLLGLCVGCKMTAGVFFALPIGILLLTRHWGRTWKSALAISAIALLIYFPWALRAAIASGGNPVFPLVANILGRDGWTAAQVDTWNRGHAAPPALAGTVGHLSALGSKLFLDSQWSSGSATWHQWMGDKPDNSPLKHLGLLWPAALLATLLALVPRVGRPEGSLSVAWKMLLLLGLQIFAWLTVTHLESRFLLPCIVPLALLMALGFDALVAAGVRGLLARFFLVFTVGMQAFFCLFILIPECGLFLGSQRLAPDGSEMPLAIGMLELFERPRALVLSDLPPEEFRSDRIYLLGDSAALYYPDSTRYNTVFDRNPLAAALHSGIPSAAVWLRDQKITLLIVDWPEIERLRGTYGYDPAVTPESMHALAETMHMSTPYVTPRGIEIYRINNGTDEPPTR